MHSSCSSWRWCSNLTSGQDRVKEGGLHQLAVTALQEANCFEQLLDLLCLCPSDQRGRLLQNLVECLEAYLLVIAGLVLRQVAKHRPGWPGLASREYCRKAGRPGPGRGGSTASLLQPGETLSG